MNLLNSVFQKINVIRALVMGANDGILSVSGIVLGMAGSNVSTRDVFLAGLSGALAGIVSMAMGEWVSVSTQRDSELSAIKDETLRVQDNLDDEIDYVVKKYISQGIDSNLARQAALEMFQKKPIYFGVIERYGFNPKDKISAVGAAITSMISFGLGSVLPLLSAVLLPKHIRVLVTIVLVTISLGCTGYVAAFLGKSNNSFKAVVRNVVSGILTMIITFTVGLLLKR